MDAIKLYEGDLPENFSYRGDIAIDTETMGLNLHRDRLCLVQLCCGDGVAHLVRFGSEDDYAAPRLRSFLSASAGVKIMHYARFDMAAIYKNFGIMLHPVFCTKLASRLTRTYSDKHGLGVLCRDVLGIELNKRQQSSDWGQDSLDEKQLSYAAADVLHLHALRSELEALLIREARQDLARSCFEFLPVRVRLDLWGWSGVDIFEHS